MQQCSLSNALALCNVPLLQEAKNDVRIKIFDAKGNHAKVKHAVQAAPKCEI